MNEPLIFDPILKVRVWGGSALKGRVADAPADPVGESWEVADHGDDTSVVAAGTCRGRSLRELFRADREGLCGQAVDPAAPTAFPLLLKLIDATDNLSVQVHPDDAYARQYRPGELGKTEAWYVLEAAPAGKVYRGVKPGVSRERFARALADGTVAGLLNGFKVVPGDVLFLPAGTLHALGAGVRIAEIQQNSDTTFRVFDWNRVGLDGQPRELHVDHALAVSDFSPSGADTCVGSPLGTPNCLHERFIECDKFFFERLREFNGRPVDLDTEGRRFHILTVVAGEVEVRAAGGTVRRGKWDSCLLPAGTGAYSLSAAGEAVVLLFYVPAG